MQIYIEELERVENLQYLTKTNDGYCTKEVNIRIAMGKAIIVELTTIWKDRNIANKPEKTNRNSVYSIRENKNKMCSRFCFKKTPPFLLLFFF